MARHGLPGPGEAHTADRVRLADRADRGLRGGPGRRGRQPGVLPNVGVDDVAWSCRGSARPGATTRAARRDVLAVARSLADLPGLLPGPRAQALDVGPVAGPAT